MPSIQRLCMDSTNSLTSILYESIQTILDLPVSVCLSFLFLCSWWYVMTCCTIMYDQFTFSVHTVHHFVWRFLPFFLCKHFLLCLLFCGGCDMCSTWTDCGFSYGFDIVFTVLSSEQAKIVIVQHLYLFKQCIYVSYSSHHYLLHSVWCI